MTEFGAGAIKSIRYTLAPNPSIGASGVAGPSFSTWQVTGRIVGIEVGSPAFNAATGSLYVLASGTTWNQTRQVTLVKGILQTRAYYSTNVYAQIEGASASGLTGALVEYPLVDGDAIGISLSGCYAGTGTAILYYV